MTISTSAPTEKSVWSRVIDPILVRGPSVAPFAAGVLAICIFVIDTVSPLQFAVAVLYVVVILLVAAHHHRRNVIVASLACAMLTVLSYLVMHGLKVDGTATARSAIGLTAICITTFLALKNLSSIERLRETERERANLARFFPPNVVDHLAQIDTPLSVARYQPAAVLFVDMVGFTACCSRMTPQAVIALLRDLLAVLSESIFSHNGTIDKFLGDGLMAVFGTPIPGPLDATNASRCALDIQHMISCWNGRRERSGETKIRVAVGIHYGDIVQGDVGSHKQLEFTVVGDTVNIASRVEAYCRVIGAAVLVTSAVVEALYAEGSADLAERFIDQGYHHLRGRNEPLRLFGVPA